MSYNDKFSHFYKSTGDKQRLNQLNLKQNKPIQFQFDLKNRVKDDKMFIDQVSEKYSTQNSDQLLQLPNKRDILYKRDQEELELMIIKAPYQQQQTLPFKKYNTEPFIDLLSKSSTPMKPTQTKLEKFFVQGHLDASRCKPLKSATGHVHHNVHAATPQVHTTDKSVINLTKMSRDEFNKTMDGLGRAGGGHQQHQEHRHQQQREQKQLEDFNKRIADKHQMMRGSQIVKDFIRDELKFQPGVQIQKRKSGHTYEDSNASRRLSTYNQLLQDDRENVHGRVKTPVVEFNFLLKYLFLRSYHENDQEDVERKVIPDRFHSSEEYQAIFEYLFLNESYACLKQELQTFVKDKKFKFRRLQVKLDDTQEDKDGTILSVRAPQEIVVNDDEEESKDGNCNLMTLHNYIVVISHTLKLDIKKFNKQMIINIESFTEPDSYLFGWLLEPQKATFLNQLKILTFADPKLFQDWKDVILIPFQKATTFIREFQMIRNLEQEQISSIIYDPHTQRPFISDVDRNTSNNNIIRDPEVLTQFFESIRPHYNDSQFKCIREISLIDRGVCLLQGPPGTGKTHTLIGLVSSIYNYMFKLGVLGERKILICAPSNAAIDEVLSRILKQGIMNEHGEKVRPKALRIGPISESHDNTLLNEHSLEDQAQRMLFQDEQFKVKTDQRTTGEVRLELARVQNQITKHEKLKIADDKELNAFYQKRRKLYNYLDEVKGNKRNQKEKYQKNINYLLERAEIICTTLASSGTDKLERFKGLIDVLIIDEAAQCTEPTNIIPLRLGVKKMILVGDPKQLPATTFSQISNQTLYNRSLFERIIQNDFSPYFLNIQYRMHAQIRQFPSKQFYDNKLTDHHSIQNRPIHNNNLALIDCSYGEEQKSYSSFQNLSECSIILQLLKFYREFEPKLSIGVVCGYKAQVKLIKGQFKTDYAGLYNKQIMSINTIDSFQGQEKDIIIFSCVRSSPRRTVGFMSDQRRINVALTRAKQTLIVVADCQTLSSDICWKDYIFDMIQRDLYIYLQGQSEESSLVTRFLTNQLEPTDKKPPPQLINLLMQESKGKNSRVVFNINDFTKEKEQKDAKQKHDMNHQDGLKQSSKKGQQNHKKHDKNHKDGTRHQRHESHRNEGQKHERYNQNYEEGEINHKLKGDRKKEIVIYDSQSIEQAQPIQKVKEQEILKMMDEIPQSFEQMMRTKNVVKTPKTCKEDCETVDDLLQLICS